MKNIFTFIIIATCLSSFGQQGGTLDVSFGSSGSVTTDFSGTDGSGYKTALQSDGKILVVGDAYNPNPLSQFAISRYNVDGSLDLTFGVGGKVLTSVGTISSIAYSLQVQPDGKIVVVGCAMNSAGTNWNFALVRYDSFGVLDNTFGIGGKVMSTISLGSTAYDLFLRPDGKIVACGTAFNGSYHSFAVARYNVDGSLDNSFGSNGQVIIHPGTGSGAALGMGEQSTGHIVLSGYTTNGSNLEIAMVRFDSLGVLDNTFGVSGIALTSIGGTQNIANDIAIEIDDKIILVGRTNNGGLFDFAVLKYNVNGTLDNTFGTNGYVITSIDISNDNALGVAIESNGRIIVAGNYMNSANKQNIAIMNYNNDGSINSNFGVNGKVMTQIGSSHCNANSVVLQSDGKIIIAGRIYNGTNNDFLVARYNNLDDLSLFEGDIDNTLSIFPNPIISCSTIHFDEFQENTLFKIADINGKEIKSSYFSGQELLFIRDENLESGSYFFEFIDRQNKKVIKKVSIQ